MGARCGLFGSSSEINLITATGPKRGVVTMKAWDTSTDTVAKEQTVDLHSSTVEWQHMVQITGLESNKTYKLEVTSDGAPLVFDGCVGNVVGSIN